MVIVFVQITTLTSASLSSSGNLQVQSFSTIFSPSSSSMVAEDVFREDEVGSWPRLPDPEGGGISKDIGEDSMEEVRFMSKSEGEREAMMSVRPIHRSNQLGQLVLASSSESLQEKLMDNKSKKLAMIQT